MGRKKRDQPSMLGLFKQYFADHPEWLRTRSSDAVLDQFRKDHPNTDVSPRIKQAMFNAKNYLKRGPKGKRRRRRMVREMQAAMARPQHNGGALQTLENHIDDCLAMARTLGRDDIADVITHLHRARNILIVKIES